MSHRLLLLLGAILCCSACTPPELTESEASFQEVAPILAERCGINACHGNPANGNFMIPNGQQASVDDVRGALEGVDTIEDMAIVEPGAPEASALYVRITAEPPQLMPPSDPLNARDIDLIRRWIDEGAIYE